MRRTITMLFVAVACTAWSAAGFAFSVEDVPSPRQQGLWVSDVANIIDPTVEANLNRMLQEAEKDLGVEIAVVTVDVVDTATPKEFATELFNYWGIGKSVSNNGMLVLLVLSQRRLEMETGYGMETVLTDGWLKEMQGTSMVPAFREGRYGPGIYNGVEASVKRLRTYAETGVLPEAGGESGGSGDGTLPLLPLLLFGGAGTVGGAGFAGRKYMQRRERTCHECGDQMQMLPEEEDDVHLTAGQLTEEALGSIDWQYWYCEPCGTGKLIADKKWFSGYKRCPECQHRTLKVTDQTVSSATEYSTGLREVTKKCAHCNHLNVKRYTIPRVSSSSSSSGGGGGGFSSGGGGGGSFGGGSSGGGGAGSSW